MLLNDLYAVIEKKIKKHLPESFHELEDAWIVGGAIREIIVNKKKDIKEIDITANIKHKDEIEKIFTKKYGESHKVNKRFQTLRFQSQKINIDITYFENSIEKDLLRRDFTLNSIAWNKKFGFFDPLKGIKDIENKKIKYSKKESIKNDPVRIFRALRISSKHKFSFDKDLKKEIKKNKHLIMNCPGERIRSELKKGFNINSTNFAKLMIETEIFEILFEEWIKTKECKANSISKMNVQEHSLKTLGNLKKITSSPGKHYPRWASQFKKITKPKWWMYLGTLLHDIGKPETICVKESKTTYPKHAQIGFELIKKDIEKLKFSNEEKNGIEKIISNHLRVSQLANNEREPTKKATNKFFRDLGDLSLFFIFLDLADASAYPKKVTKEILTKSHLKIHDFLFESFFLKKEKIMPKPLLNGEDLIRIGYKEGPKIGKVLKKITDLQISEKITNSKQAINYASKELETQ